MLIGLAVLCIVLSMAASIWMLVIIFKRSIIGGLLSLFFGFPVLYFLVTGWGKEGQDIKKPFFLSFILWGLAAALAFTFAKEFVELTMPEEPVQPTRPTAPFREPSTSGETIRINETPSPAPQPAAVPRAVSVPQVPQVPAMPAQRTQPVRTVVQEAPPRPRAPQSNCVYKPVMTDEDLEKCK